MFFRHGPSAPAFAVLLFLPAGISADMTVAFVEGDALVRLSGRQDWAPLEPGVPLATGDRVKTEHNAAVSLATADGDVMDVQEGTELEVRAAEEGFSAVKIWLGGLLAKVTPRQDKKFEVHTPLAVAGVRGTEFAVDVAEDGASEAGVVEGAVAFRSSGAAAAEEILLAGQQSAALRPLGRPERLPDFSPRMRGRLSRLESLRQRAPSIQKKWRRLSPEKRRQLRRKFQKRWDRRPEHKRRAAPEGRRAPR